MADIFISYSSKDRALAVALAADLEARGHTVWWDFNLVGGQGFREQIHAELIAARAVIVIWTRDSVASKWVRDEADEADRLGKLIPVRVPKLAMHDIPMGHRGNQTYTIDARERIYEALAEFAVIRFSDDGWLQAEITGLHSTKPYHRSRIWLRLSVGATLTTAIAGIFIGIQLKRFDYTTADCSNIQNKEQLAALRAFAGEGDGKRDGGLADDELRRLENVAWEMTKKIGTINAYTIFRIKWPQSSKSAQAQDEIEGLQSLDEATWAKTVKAGTKKGMREYLKKWPSGAHARDARATLGISTPCGDLIG